MKTILRLYVIPDKVIGQIHCMYLGSRSQASFALLPSLSIQECDKVIR